MLHALLQDARMSTAMKYCQNPNLASANGVVDAVKLKATNRYTAHIGKADAIVQRRVAQRADGTINLIEKLSAQPAWRFSYQIAASSASSSASGSLLRAKFMQPRAHALDCAVPGLD